MGDRANRSVYTSSTAGHRLGYSDERIRQLCEAGRFPGAFRDGHAGHWRIPAESIDAFLESVKPKVRRKA
jgi:excisionase family DNA binding protein